MKYDNPNEATSPRKPRARFDNEVRAWDISQFHCQNYLKFGGVLGDTPMQ